MQLQQRISKLNYSSWHWTTKYGPNYVVKWLVKLECPLSMMNSGSSTWEQIKHIWLETCPVKDNCLPLRTKTDSELNTGLDWNAKIPLYRQPMDFSTEIICERITLLLWKWFYLFIITEVILSHISERWSHVTLHVLLPPVPVCFQGIIGTFDFVFKFPNLFWELSMNCKHEKY